MELNSGQIYRLWNGTRYETISFSERHVLLRDVENGEEWNCFTSLLNKPSPDVHVYIIRGIKNDIYGTEDELNTTKHKEHSQYSVPWIVLET